MTNTRFTLLFIFALLAGCDENKMPRTTAKEYWANGHKYVEVCIDRQVYLQEVSHGTLTAKPKEFCGDQP